MDIFKNHLDTIQPLLEKLPIRILKVTRFCKFNCVLIENRNDPHIETILLNMINFTHMDIGVQIFYTNENKNFINNIIGKYNLLNINTCQVIGFDLRTQYNEFLFSKFFYDNVIGEKILIFQTDSLLLQQLDMKYFEYDWIGAPWYFGDRHTMKEPFKNKLRIGNGGFNIRNIKKCNEIAKKFKYQIPKFSVKYHNALWYFPSIEDLSYSYLLQEEKTSVFPSIEIAKEFSVEVMPHDNPIAVHAFYKYFDRSYVNIILKKHKNLLQKIYTENLSKIHCNVLTNKNNEYIPNKNIVIGYLCKIDNYLTEKIISILNHKGYYLKIYNEGSIKEILTDIKQLNEQSNIVLFFTPGSINCCNIPHVNEIVKYDNFVNPLFLKGTKKFVVDFLLSRQQLSPAVHPICFCIPEEKISISKIDHKTKVLSNLIPGDLSTYIYNTEDSYYKEYQASYFAHTKKKAGWDCLRHYEIIANGCLPVFENIENCPTNSCFLLPKDLIINCNHLYDQVKELSVEQLSEDFFSKYLSLRNELIQYMRDYLTTEQMATYILKKTGNEKIQNVLIIGNLFTEGDYLLDLLTHGFKKKFKNNCYDFPQNRSIYNNPNLQFTNFYGKGFTYSNLLDPSEFSTNSDINSLIENIKNKFFDVIIYPTFFKGLPFYEIVTKHYNPSEIILIDGTDECKEDKTNFSLIMPLPPFINIINSYIAKGHPFFIRESYYDYVNRETVD